MTRDERDEFWIRAYRLRAGAYRGAAARDEMCAVAIEAARSFRHLSETISAAEAADIATHPCLAELNVQLNGYYGDDH
ncbi:hypothetical protein ABTX81_30495 [Kitasatospora sp. NPDC097605]|uniref:hypothetical protein n=1 Tax=Kitasatospora sp. NPDC097605 TaxID=3157226 RepID=UPI00331653C8